MPDNAPLANKAPAPLPASALYRHCDPEHFSFKTTADLEPLGDTLVQARATEAIRFGLGIRRDGYNLFAIGPEGTGKRTIIDQFTRRQAATEPTPPDWVYVNNFNEPHKPRALSLPAGRGSALRQDMRGLIDELQVALPAAFESDDYRTRRQSIDETFKERREKAFREVEAHAKERNIGIIRTPVGIALAPMRNGEVIPPEEFSKFQEDEQQRIQKEMNAVHDELQAVLRQAPKWDSEHREKVRELNQEVTRASIGYRLDAVSGRYSDLPNVIDHLKIVERDLVENAQQFLSERGDPDGPVDLAAKRALGDRGLFDRYRINLLVDHSLNGGAPVVEEDHPTLQNLLGRVEYRHQFGNLVTDFTLIKPGALHQANGGYLILDARRVLLEPFAWEELKRALRAGEVQIRSVADSLGLISTVTLQPSPIPVNVKAVLVGDRILYYLLSDFDPDFRELFKVVADFDDEVERSANSEQAYAQLIASITRREKTLPLDREAVARVIEHAARLAGDAERVTARLEAIADLLREADHLARVAERDIIGRADVEETIELQIRRSSRFREHLQEEIERGTILIDAKGERVGQVNGLSVLQLGGFAFGRPSRISASVRLGHGQVIDIEREAKLGGPIHSKGVMILSGFLGARFGRERPLALLASLVFEQSYGGVEGDSASLAELCAILSALARVPIHQGIAITGSVNQNGEAQAIGGVNEKIEGFFDVCHAVGLTGNQGVIIPTSNMKHLMLRADVVAAAAAGAFSIYAVSNVDEAMAILTGVESGVRTADGPFPAGTINRLAEDELASMAERAKAFGSADRKESGG